MGQTPIDAVLAGTKGFAVALFAPLTAKVGTRPRVAGDPGQVLGLCSGPSALAVIEFTGEGSLSAVQALVRDGGGLRVVAGLPPAHAGAESTLRALGVEVGPWDGKIDGVIAAVARAVAAMSGAPAPAATGSLAPSKPAPAAAPPPPGASIAAPAAPSPAARPAAAGPRPAATVPASTSAVRSAAGAGSPARTQPTGPPVTPRPASPQAAARAPSVQRPGPALAPATSKPAAAPSPVPRAPPAAASLPRTSVQPPAPVPSGQPAAPRRPATTEVAARPPPAPAALAPAPPAGAAPVLQPAASPRPAAQFFADLDTDVSVDVDDLAAQPGPPAASVDFHSPGVYVPPPSEPAVDWPGGICSGAEAEDGLQRALRGAVDGSRPLHDLAVRTLETLSDLERAVLSGEPQPIDVAPVRKAAVMRLRVAEALASVPPPGSPVDSAALSAVLGEIDALLAEVAPLLSGAPEELVPALEEIRNALVREAIDFSEAAQRTAVAGAEQEARPAAAPSARAGAARVLSYDSAQKVEIETHERRRHWIGVAVLVALTLLALGYHGWRHFSRGQFRAQPTVPGAPANTVASVGKGKVQLVFSRTGKFDLAELKRFKEEQELRGNRVEEVSPGVLKITPATEPEKK